MGADGVLGDEQPAGDLVRPVVLVEQEQHLELASREERRDAVGHARAARARAHLLEQPARDRAGEGCLAVHDTVEELRDPLGRLRLEEVAGSAAANRSQEVLLGPGGREDDDLATGRRLTEPRQRRETVEAGHQEVEEDEVGLSRGRGCDGLVTVRRETDKLEAVRTQKRRKRLAGQRMVVDDEDASCHGSLIGSSASADKG